VTPEEKRRDSSLRRVYNLTLEEYRRILMMQGGRCFVCERELSGISNPVDHEHVSGQIRGILCSYCNHRVVGRQRDWRIAQRVADYLREPPAVRVIGVRVVPRKKPKRKVKKVIL
jgi:DNA-directed RNA polymerase subunit RPC12/RpoP